ncbi:hypothetical protein SCHPADRAFT_85562 [Schizopora paradoxa]|uniref:Uncharacterized protein n=1 Tax=Schizopora paradoxa TaxID=27342 RepID=A0A0H2SBC2_9AGAM|nr:hypothetical protein SCHPADRAFT_85562 [Schizopora paradoxa]
MQLFHAVYRWLLACNAAATPSHSLFIFDSSQNAIKLVPNGMSFPVNGNSPADWQKAGKALYEYLKNDPTGQVLMQNHGVAGELGKLETAYRTGK